MYHGDEWFPRDLRSLITPAVSFVFMVYCRSYDDLFITICGTRSMFLDFRDGITLYHVM